MICTIKDDPPDVKVMRCVPFSWCVKSSVAPRKIWDDTGAGGGKPGSVWVINTLEMIAVVPGHEAPTDDFYDLEAESKLSFDGLLATLAKK